MSANYLDVLNRDARIALSVDFTTKRGVVVDYALVLLAGTKFHSGSLGEGMRAAIEDVKRNYFEMVEGWRAR